MLSGLNLKRVAYALILLGICLLVFLRHVQIEESGNFRWFDRPILFVTVPVARGVRAVREAVSHVFQRYFFLVGVEKENEAIQQEMERIQERQLLQEEALRENERLRSILDLKSEMPVEATGARVVATPTLTPYRMVIIDKGEEEGVERRSPIVASEGLVGQVVRVFPHESQVLLITDPTSAVDGRIDQSDSRGLVVGKVMQAAFKHDVYVSAFDYLNRTTEIEEGTKVFTSGMDGIFPAGIPIGFVHGSKKKKYDIFQQAEVMPFVDFYRLREVLVLKPRKELH